jgi:peptidoglycan hydrolase CwlO-like protein
MQKKIRKHQPLSDMPQTDTHFENIHDVISEQLRGAREEIKAAVAWFTDSTLIELLGRKAKEGVRVQVIVAENDANSQIDYSLMTQHGVALHVYPAAGYGGMHHKFCVVDRRTAMTGSYNWTVNARRNNGENLMVTDDPESVRKCLEAFDQMLAELQGDAPAPAPSPPRDPSTPKNAPAPMSKQPDEIPVVSSFEEEWNIFLNSTVRQYDRGALIAEGRAKAESTLADPTVLPQQLDTIYQRLLLDTEVDGDTITMLRHRLDQRIELFQDHLAEQLETGLHLLESRRMADERAKNAAINQNKTEQDVLQAERNTLSNDRIPAQQAKQEACREAIEAIDRDMTRPPIRRRVWAEGFLLFTVTLCLFLFYSSVFYTFLYGMEDARKAQEMGQTMLIEVFNAQALGLAWDKGIMVLLFVLAVPALPFAFGFLAHNLPNKIKQYIYIFVAFVLDILLAYIICKTSYELDYLVGSVTEPWSLGIIWDDPTKFLIVLLMGFVTFLTWGALLEHIWKQLDAVSKHELFNKKQVEKAQLQEHQVRLGGELEALKARMADIESEMARLRGAINGLQGELHYLQPEMEQQRAHLKAKHAAELQKLDNQRTKILAYLDRDRIPVSYSALLDRINTFFDGWYAWAFSHYAANKAQGISLEARDAVDAWLAAKKKTLG